MSNIIKSIVSNPGKYKLREHQIEAMYFAENKPNVQLLWGVGSGKTGAAISIARMRNAQEGRRLRTLVLCPVVVIGNFANEFKLFSNYSQDTVHKLNQASSKKKAEYMRKHLSSDGVTMDLPDVVVVNYDSIITPDLAQAIAEWQPELIIFDEFHRLKSSKAKRTRVCKILAKTAKYKVMLSGTSILNSAQDVFAPFHILDNGETFGTNEYVFQAKYMRDENAGWKGKVNYFPKWVTNTKMTDDLHAKIFTKAIRKRTEECVDLPPFNEILIEVEAGKEQKKAYNDMLKNHLAFIASRTGESKAVTANLAMTKALRLLQIASGYAQTEDGEIIRFKNNPRMDACSELLETLLNEGEKVILWCSYIENYRMLEDLLSGMKVKYALLTGAQSAKEKDQAIESFQNDPECKVIIANRKAGGIGVNLTAAKYSIVYSRNFSLEEEIQSTGRNYRGGSEHFDNITKYDLAMKDSVDLLTIQALKNKQSVADLIIDPHILKGATL